MKKEFELTRQQEGLWVEWKLDQGQTSFNTYVQLKLEGDLKIERFCNAASDVVGYFDMLHSYFIERDGKPLMKFSDEKYILPLIDYSDLDLSLVDKEKKALKLIEEKRDTNINLKKFPLVQAALIKVDKNIYYFTGVVPHIISDGASAIFFLQALSKCYNDGVIGLKEEFDGKQVPWADYLSHEKSKLSKEDKESATKYWQENLKFIDHNFDFGKKTQANSILGKRAPFTIEADIAKILRKLAFKNRTSIFSVIGAIFGVFLNRYYQQNSAIIGYPVNLRPAGFRYSFGLFVNILPLHINIEDDFTFNNLIKHIDKKRREDKKHQLLPSLDIVRAKRFTDPDFDGNMFNISMVETISRLQNLTLNDIKSTPLDNENIEVRNDLSLIYEITEEKIYFWLEYCTELFADEEIAKIAQNMESLVNNLAKNPDEKIFLHELLDEKEQNLVKKLAQAKEKDVKANSMIKYFEEFAKNYPEEVALRFDGEEISYKELDEKANILANYLKEPQKVLVKITRSFEQIIALIAILKSGGTYIPIDVNTPKQRVDEILKDSEAKITLSQEGVIKILDENSNNKSPNSQINSDDLAYIIYTSGSSGKPKGVALTHKNVICRLEFLMNFLPEIKVKSQILHNTNYSFDISVAEIFWSLSVGATLNLVNQEKSRDFNYILQIIKENKVEAFHMVPSASLALLNFIQNKEDFSSIKYLISVGEDLSKNMVDKFYETSNGKIFNAYGPTEAAIYCTFEHCKENEEVAIGKPIENSSIYILDKDLRILPQNAIGEIYIGGKGIAKGYIKRDELNKEKFINNPHGEGKLYASGDLGYLRNDGNIIYLGRKDNQIKLRGFRIELDEIDANILKLEKVEQAVTAVKNNQIISYFCGKNYKDQEIESHLKELLPYYMMPNKYVHLESIPRLDSNKIDYKSLPDVKIDKISEDFVKPKSKKEKIMAKIFADILNIDKKLIGINNNFFNLGGDSLMTIQITCRAQENEIYLDSEDIFLYPTIKLLLENAKDHKQISNISQDEIVGEVKILPRAQRFLDDKYQNQNHYNRAVMIGFSRTINEKILQDAISDVSSHHDGLRASYKKENGQWKCYNHSTELLLELEVFDLKKIKRDSKRQETIKIINQAQSSLEISKAPLFKALYLKNCGDFKAKLVLVIHHILMDMTSLRLILEDIVSNYQRRVSKISQKPLAKTTSLKELSDYIHKQAKEKYSNQEIQFWQDRLNAVNLCKLPYKSSQGMALESSARMKLIKIKAKEFDKYFGKEQMNIEVLSWFSKAFKKWTNSEKLAILTSSHGRDFKENNADLSRTVGWINSVYPMSVNLDSEDITEEIKNELESIKGKDQNYMILKHLQKDPKITNLNEPKIFFNYVSQINNTMPDKIPAKLLELPKEVNNICPNNKLTYDFSVEVAIFEKDLHLVITYSEDHFKEKDVEVLSNLLCRTP